MAADRAVWAVVVGGGSGSRFGGAKQFASLGGRRVIDWSIEACRTVAGGVVVVLPADAPNEPTADATVPGGATRSASVRAGLAAVAADAEVILVHDAARPLADAALFGRVVDAVRAGADAAVPACPVTDTVRWRDGGVVDREQLVAVQTPQGFAAEALRTAHADGPEATDDVSVVEAAGGSVVVVDGDRRNLKITDRDDLRVAEALSVPA